MPPISRSSFHHSTAVRSSVVDAANINVSQTSYPTFGSVSSAVSAPLLDSGKITGIAVSTAAVIISIVTVGVIGIIICFKKTSSSSKVHNIIIQAEDQIAKST